jgi:hypothetical protein
VGYFTPLETIDTLVVPFHFSVAPLVAITKDDVPVYMGTIIGMGADGLFDRTIRLEELSWARYQRWPDCRRRSNTAS